MAMAINTITWVLKEAAAAEPSDSTMISADKIKSVRMAPLILAASSTTSVSVAWSSWCKNLCASFSTPSKHKNAPPTIINGVINQGAKALMRSAKGTKIALLSIEPLATAQTTGNSRSAFTPVTCWAFRARSSPNTPEVFFTATLVMAETSSRSVVMSSSNANRLVAMV